MYAAQAGKDHAAGHERADTGGDEGQVPRGGVEADIGCPPNESAADEDIGILRQVEDGEAAADPGAIAQQLFRHLPSQTLARPERIDGPQQNGAGNN